MSRLFRQIRLPDDITINFFDQTRVYFGDFYLVKLEIQCIIPAVYSETTEGFTMEPVPATHPKHVMYKRYLQKMGVPSSALLEVKHSLVADFEMNSLPYIISKGFSVKLVNYNQPEKVKKVKRYQENLL